MVLMILPIIFNIFFFIILIIQNNGRLYNFPEIIEISDNLFINHFGTFFSTFYLSILGIIFSILLTILYSKIFLVKNIKIVNIIFTIISFSGSIILGKKVIKIIFYNNIIIVNNIYETIFRFFISVGFFVIVYLFRKYYIELRKIF